MINLDIIQRDKRLKWRQLSLIKKNYYCNYLKKQIYYKETVLAEIIDLLKMNNILLIQNYLKLMDIKQLKIKKIYKRQEIDHHNKKDQNYGWIIKRYRDQLKELVIDLLNKSKKIDLQKLIIT